MEAAKKKIRTCPACGEKIEFTKLILYTMHGTSQQSNDLQRIRVVQIKFNMI